MYARDGSTRAAVLDAILYPDRVDVPRILSGLAEGHLSMLTAEEKLDRIAEIINATEEEN